MSRHLLVGLALSAACLGIGCDGAEARARIGFGRSHVAARPSAVPTAARVAVVPSAALPLRTASATDRVAERVSAGDPVREEPVRTGGIPAVPGSTDAVTASKPDSPWCAKGTVVGSGRGFCIIN